MAGYHSRRYRDFIEKRNRERKKHKYRIVDAEFFNGLSLRDQDSVIALFESKLRDGELQEFLEDKTKAIEYVTRIYMAQKCAFEDVITKQGFEPTIEVLKDIEARIACLTKMGSLLILGKSSPRTLRMNRIHKPRFNMYDGTRGNLDKDLKIGNNLSYVVEIPENFRGLAFTTSCLRGLAINSHGADSDELEGRNVQTIFNAYDTETERHFDLPDRELQRKYSFIEKYI